MSVFEKKENHDLFDRTTNKKESLVLVCKCTQFNKKFCIRLDRYEGSSLWIVMVAFPFQPEMESENYESNSRRFTGKIVDSDSYNGCPFCGSKKKNFCSCGNIFDTPKTGKLLCPWCNKTANFTPNEIFNFGGTEF